MTYGPLQALGIELEYMIVRADDLNVAPIADQIFIEAGGGPCNEVKGQQNINWSNELVRHVIELKNPKPVFEVGELLKGFNIEIHRLSAELEKKGCILLPTAMHPWMDPETDTQLWPLEQNKIYQTYDRIFKCKGHGWANLQSTHINLSFGQTDQDFGLSHAALRVITPLIPIIASSSPYQMGKRGPYLSTRLFHYFQNQRRIPSIIGPVIPEPIWTLKDYETKILQPMYREIAPFDTEALLQDDWLNSRAVIAKFDYNRLEIRVMDNQECPQADLAIAWFFIELARKLAQFYWCDESTLKNLSSEELKFILDQAAREADKTVINNKAFLKCFGINNPRIEGLELLRHLFSEIKTSAKDQQLAQTFESLLKRGPLSRCMLKQLGDEPHKEAFKEFYSQLSKNLAYDQIYSE